MDQLSLTLHERYGHLGITALREIGRGLDARVYRGESAALGLVVLPRTGDQMPWLCEFRPRSKLTQS